MKPIDRLTRHQEFLKSILSQNLDSPERLHSAIVEAANLLLPCRARRLWRLNPLANAFILQVSQPPITDPLFIKKIPVEHTFSGEAIEAKAPKFYENVRKQPLLLNKDSFELEGLEDLWVVPIFLSHEKEITPYGTLLLYPAPESRHLTIGTEEMHLLSIITNIIKNYSPALDRERMASKLQLGRRPDETYPQFWDRVAESIANELGFYDCTLFVADRTKEKVGKVGAHNFRIESEAEEAVLSNGIVEYAKGISATGRTLEQNRTIFSQDVHKEKWCSPNVDKLRDNPSYLATPINTTAGGEILGIVRCIGKHRPEDQLGQDTINEDDVARIEAVAKELRPIVQHYRHAEDNRVLWALASHDIRAPVNFIHNAAGMILKRQKNHEAKKGAPLLSSRVEKYIRDIFDATQIVQLLVDMLATGAEDEIRYKFRRVHLLSHSLAKIIHLLRPTAKKFRVKMEYDEDFKDFPILWLDQQRFEIVLYNVLSNAIKYSEINTRIWIYWTVEKGNYLIRVSNWGSGIPGEEREKIFRPFYRSVIAERSAIPGMGLGLFIVRRIMTAHSGSVKLTRLKDPTTFTLSLPARLTHEKPTTQSVHH